MFAILATMLKAPVPRPRFVLDLQLELAAEPAPAADEPPRGCGWFESSHELQTGLSVTEHASAEALPNELPLDDWIEFHLHGWRAQRS